MYENKIVKKRMQTFELGKVADFGPVSQSW